MIIEHGSIVRLNRRVDQNKMSWHRLRDSADTEVIQSAFDFVYEKQVDLFVRENVNLEEAYREFFDGSSTATSISMTTESCIIYPGFSFNDSGRIWTYLPIEYVTNVLDKSILALRPLDLFGKNKRRSW